MKLTVRARLGASILIISLVLMGAAMVTVLHSYRAIGLRDAWARVEDMARDAEDDAGYDSRGRLVLDDDVVMYAEGITVVYLDENGDLLRGAYPLSFPDDVALAIGEDRRINGGASHWLVYDVAANDGFYVRALMSTYELDSGFYQMALISGGVVVLFAVLMAISAWAMARRAFRPVSELTRHADSIRGGGQLGARLPVPDTHDEIARLAETFNAMFARLDESFRAERQFTSDASHELRTPVGAILAQCELGLLGDDAERLQALEAIYQRAQHMSTLVNRLLMLARAEQGRQTLAIEPLDVRQLCGFACESLEDSAQEAGVKLELLPGGDAPTINGDSALVVSLITNLIGNAIKYRDPSKPERYVRVSVTGQDGEARVSVADNGIGIPEEHLGRVFDRFYRVDSARGGEGVGLGLCLSAWIARAHGGGINVDSRAGEGSTFTATLRNARAEQSRS